jgi:Kef-type K+ transport system membrane component KefB
MRSEMSMTDTWSTLFGVSLLVIGTAARFALSTLTASFVMGLTVSALSSRRNRLRVMVGPTERPVLLPALVIAGARLDFRTTAALPWLAAAAVGARFVAQLVGGWILAAGWRTARGAGPLVGLSFCTSGALSMAIALAFAFRFPGFVGDTVLAVAVVSAIVGEFVGPARLRRSLQRARELEPPARAEPVGA